METNGQTFLDFREDFELLLYLVDDLTDKLSKTKHDLVRVKSEIRETTRDTIEVGINLYFKRLELTRNEIIQTQTLLLQYPQSTDLIIRLIQIKYAIYEKIRSISGIVAALAVSADWQSPTFAHSLYSMAGRQTGQIMGTINDYKRDRHQDARDFEQNFIKEYVHIPLKFNLVAYATSSGMAAFTTIFNFLITEKKVTRIIAGRSTYFEALGILSSYFGSGCRLVNETDTSEIITEIDKFKPEAIFLDTIGNTQNIPVADIDIVIRYLKDRKLNRTYLVLDNTFTNVKYQPLKYLSLLNSPSIIVYESLNKFHQFGLDRVTGGIIYGKCRDYPKLYNYRDHLGTNIPDASVFCLPRPNRKHLEIRMNRINRNANLITDLINQKICNKPQKVTWIVHPDISTFCTMEVNPQFRTVKAYQNIISSILNQAKKDHLQIVSGTSFGLPVSRIYLTATRADTTIPFIRFSPGTETDWEIRHLGESICKALI